MASNSYRFQVGTFQCSCISDGTFDYPTEAFAANVPTERFQEELRAHHLPTDHITSPYTSLLIDTSRHKVLIDTGAGFAPTNGHLLPNLRAAGVAPADIDTVILTHGHADHVGGNLDADASPAFPNARYVMAQAEWEFWTGAPNLGPMPIEEPLKHLLIATAQRNLPPLRPQIDLLDREIEIVLGTPPDAPKMKALQEGARVALTIDSDHMPYKVLLIRGTVHIDTVEGLSPEYVSTSRRVMGEEAGNAWLAHIGGLVPRMTRIFIRPDWVAVQDFETRFPNAVEWAIERAQVPA